MSYPVRREATKYVDGLITATEGLAWKKQACYVIMKMRSGVHVGLLSWMCDLPFAHIPALRLAKPAMALGLYRLVNKQCKVNSIA